MVKQRYLSIVILLALSFVPNILFSQLKILKLSDAIKIAQQNSFDYKLAINKYRSDLWNYKNYKAYSLPSLFLEGIIPSYSHSINRITLSNGEDTFVNQNQAYSTLNLGVKQNIFATGGILSVGSSLSRIDVFGNNKKIDYSTVPMTISYIQNTIGFNNFKWLKKIEPLRLELAQRQLVSNLEEIATQTVEYYFNMIAAHTHHKLSKQNLTNIDTLNRIANDRYKLGTVSQSELLQLRLNLLNAESKLREDSVNFVLARQKISRYLLISEEELMLEIPEVVSFYKINFEDALEKAKENSQIVIDFRIKRLEAEKNIAQINAENKLKFNVQANFGLSNTSANFSSLYSNLINQQNVSIGFSVPLLDWGVAKTRKLRAEADLEIVKSEAEQKQLQLEQEIALQISRWNIHQRSIEVAIEAKEIAEKNYDLELQRYRKGNISINDLNASQNQKDNASNSYVENIDIYWQLCYIIRKLTLFDFDKKERVNYQNYIF